MSDIKFVDITTYDWKNTGTTFTEDSQTRQSDYEDINSMVARIIRGEIIPQMPEEFEYDEKDSNDDIFSEEHPLDDENFDFSDAGSIYQDDIRQGLKNLQNEGNLRENTPNKQVTNQEQEKSGANTNSSSDSTVPVDNLDNLNETK